MKIKKFLIALIMLPLVLGCAGWLNCSSSDSSKDMSATPPNNIPIDQVYGCGQALVDTLRDNDVCFAMHYDGTNNSLLYVSACKQRSARENVALIKTNSGVDAYVDVFSCVFNSCANVDGDVVGIFDWVKYRGTNLFRPIDVWHTTCVGYALGGDACGSWIHSYCFADGGKAPSVKELEEFEIAIDAMQMQGLSK